MSRASSVAFFRRRLLVTMGRIVPRDNA
jgi:hypothetical protein